MTTTRPLPWLSPEPRRRAGNGGVGLPSDTACWLDCVAWHEPAFEYSLAQQWGTGWPSRWTIRRDDARTGTVTTTVDLVRPEHFALAESTRRMSNRYGQSNRSGIAYLSATGRHHAFESITEESVLWMIDFCDPRDVVTQPLQLTWHDGDRPRRHTPDFLVFGRDGTIVVNVKPQEFLRPEDDENFRAMTAVAHRLGWRHLVVTGRLSPQAQNLDALTVGRNAPYDPTGLRSLLADALASGPTAFGDLVALTAASALARAVLLGMIWDRQAAIDLSVRLTDRSPVRAAEGPRR